MRRCDLETKSRGKLPDRTPQDQVDESLKARTSPRESYNIAVAASVSRADHSQRVSQPLIAHHVNSRHRVKVEKRAAIRAE